METDKVKDLFKGLNNVVYIYSKKRLTVGKKRNMLNRYAKGYIRIHMDDDDYYPPNKVAHAVKKLMNSDRLIAGCSLTFCYIIKKNYYINQVLLIEIMELMEHSLIKKSILTHTLMMNTKK